MTHYDFLKPNEINKELNMTIDKNRIEIDTKDIRKGDLIRREHGERAEEYRATDDGRVRHTGNTARYFLLDRPKKVKWAKGTTLYGTRDWYGWFNEGDPLIVTKDYFEGDDYVSLRVPRGKVGCWVEGDGITDIKPEPHPVGATRWVTEDFTSLTGARFKKGDRVRVEQIRAAEDDPSYDIIVVRDRGVRYVKSKYLSATPVEPAPVYVSVRKDALDKLRDLHDVSTGTNHCVHTRAFLASVDA